MKTVEILLVLSLIEVTCFEMPASQTGHRPSQSGRLSKTVHRCNVENAWRNGIAKLTDSDDTFSHVHFFVCFFFALGGLVGTPWSELFSLVAPHAEIPVFCNVKNAWRF
jgi:hypothetical protein